MNVWKRRLLLLLSMGVLSGCVSNKDLALLQEQNRKQALLIEKQKASIASLKDELKITKRLQEKKLTPTPPLKPKRAKVVKKVEDTNFNTNYMYPKKETKKPKVTPQTNAPLTKERCIEMIGEAKFQKYAKMFGNEEASMKRCRMLESMNH